MPEVAPTLGFASALLMVLSIAIWASWLQGPLFQRLDGRRPSNVAPAGLAIKLLLAAFAGSAVAAILAIVGWISL